MKKIYKGATSPKKIPPYLSKKLLYPKFIEPVYDDDKLNTYISTKEDIELLWEDTPMSINYDFTTTDKIIQNRIISDLSPRIEVVDTANYRYNPSRRFVCNHKKVIIDDVEKGRVAYINDDMRVFGPINRENSRKNENSLLRKAQKSTVIKIRNKNVISSISGFSFFPKQYNSKENVAVPMLEKAHSYGHFLITHLPKIHRAKLFNDVTGLTPTILIRNGCDWQRDIISTLGFSDFPIREVSAKDYPILVENLVYTDQKYIGSSDYKFCKEDLNWVRKNIKENLTDQITDHSNRLLVSRQNYDRCIGNFESVKNLLLEYGFEICEPEKLSFENQAKLFNNAEVIVGASGSNMANVLFSSDCNIIGIHHRNKPIPGYPSISLAIGNEWHGLIGEEHQRKSEKKEDNLDIQINIADLRRIIEKML